MTSDDLKLLMRAGNPLIAVETPDEPRALNMVREAAQKSGLPLAEWSVTEGLISASKTLVEAGKVIAALRHVKKTEYPEVFVFKDLGPHCKDPQVVRAIRDLYFSPDSRLWTMILIDALPLPPEVHRMTVPFDIGWPDEEELRSVVRDTFQDVQRRSLREVEARLTKREMELLVQTLHGLTSEEALARGGRSDSRRSGPGRDRFAEYRGGQAEDLGDDRLSGVDHRRRFAR